MSQEIRPCGSSCGGEMSREIRPRGSFLVIDFGCRYCMICMSVLKFVLKTREYGQ